MNRRPVIAKIRHYLSLTALAAVIVLWMLFLRPASLGGPVSYIIIRGSSMLPRYASGDLIIVRTTPDYQVGDVVAYRVPDGDIGSGLIVIHRIVGSGHNAFTMRGDNNAAIDPWTPQPDDVLGKAWLTISGFGRVLSAIHQPVVLAALAASIAAAIVVTWRPKRQAARRGRVAVGSSPPASP
jgi:signal peptidase I